MAIGQEYIILKNRNRYEIPFIVFININRINKLT